MKTFHFVLIKHLKEEKNTNQKHFCLFVLSQFKELRVIWGAYNVILDNRQKKGKVVVTDALLREEEK